MRQKSVSEPVLYQDPQKAHALIDAFTRGLLAGAAERPRVCALQAESASRAGWASASRYLNKSKEKAFMKDILALLALCAAPLLVQAQDNCTSPNSNGDYILGVVDGVASAMHWDSGLVWKRCSEGQVFGAGECTGTAQAKNWNTWAEAYLPQSFTGQSSWGISEGLSQNLLHSGAWRMACKNELLRITANCQSKPFVNQEVFPDTPANSF